MFKLIKFFILFSAVIFMTSNMAIAGGLSSHFVEVKLKNLEPGKTYSIKEETGKLLDIKNTTEKVTIDIGIEAEKPADYNLITGYEPIPDLSWITIEKNYFKRVGPGESVETDILISIPKDGEYAGKRYQVYIYSHTAGTETFRMGLMGRILIDMADSLPEYEGSKRSDLETRL